MKKLFLLVACMVISFAKIQAQASLNLKDIANGHYYPEQIYGVNPMNDGETYTQISPTASASYASLSKAARRWAWCSTPRKLAARRRYEA